MTNRYRISVHATPGARRNRVGGSHDGALRVSVIAPADKGKANQAIAKQLASVLRLKVSQLEIRSGHTHRRKVFELCDPPSDIEARIASLMQSD